MPFFEFVDKHGHQRCVRVPLSELPALIERMKEQGWARLYSIPNVTIVPGYQDALQESHSLVASEDRKRARERVEAAQDVAREAKREA